MNVVSRGVRNAFRNTIRTIAVMVILGVSIGLALVMLLSRQTVQARINTVKATVGTTITISPAGARGFFGGGEPLTDEQANQISGVNHVASIVKTLNETVFKDNNTSLNSAVEPGTLGKRQSGVAPGARVEIRGNVIAGGPDGSTPKTLIVPITVNGTNDFSNDSGLGGSKPTLTSGTVFAADSDENIAIIGKDLAEKNSLTVGSTFSLYNTDVKVTGIFDSGNSFGNNGLYLPIKSLQRLSGHSGEISTITARVDSVDHAEAATSSIKSALGDKADVVSQLESAKDALEPLENIKTIATYSLVGAIVAGGVILFLTMLMIVRERRREIGVLKAIGAGDGTVMAQFAVESLVLTVMGAIVGAIGGVLLSNPILKMMLTAQSSSSGPSFSTSAAGGTFKAAGPVAMRLGDIGAGLRDVANNLSAVIDWHIVLYGLLVALAIALIGSVVPAWIIAKIRPAEAMRGE